MKKRPNFFVILLAFLLINFIFNFRLWSEFLGNKLIISDNIITEFIVEKSYQNVIHFKNPFITKSIFYPFTTNFALNDPGTAYVLPFIFLRPFLDPHRSLLVITLLGFFLNNFLMYLLLRKLKIGQGLSTLIALIFGFTPFLSHRIQGHYTYIPIYFFPLTFLMLKKLLETIKTKDKYIISFLFGFLMAVILLSNFYYFFMIILGFIFFAGYWLFIDKKKLLILLKKNIAYFFISIVSAIFFLIPWILAVYDLIKTQGLVKTPGFGGAITLSADILSFFTPSEYNPIYKIFFSMLASIIPLFSKYNHFFLNSWERFAYPGIIVLGIYFLIILLKILKKFPFNLWNKIKQYFVVSLVFAVLTLGPFLKVFNRWSINLEGVSVVFPLPFLLLHYIPGLSTLRAPSRFTPIFIFLACIVAAYVINFIFIKISKKRQIILLIGLFLIFFIDQFYAIPTKLNQEIPTQIYNYLKDKPQGTVLEIPFTVRDGFQYIGFVHALQPMYGQAIHGKPIIGGYIARVSDNIFNYYKNLKFINYLANIIDKGNYIPLKEKPRDINFFPYPYSISTAENEVQSLKIKYVVLKEDEKYSNYLINLFKQIGFTEKQKDNNYLLLEK